MFKPAPGGSAQPSWPWWVCSRQYRCFRWDTMLSLMSGTEICSRTLPLSKDRVLSPENISVIMRATTGITWRDKGVWIRGGGAGPVGVGVGVVSPGP